MQDCCTAEDVAAGGFREAAAGKRQEEKVYQGGYFVNKAELIASVSEKTGFTKKDSEAAVNAFVACVEEALVAGDKVQLIGFGTFETRERKARQGRNPRKPGETIEIAASKAPVFKAGKALKDSVNK